MLHHLLLFDFRDPQKREAKVQPEVKVQRLSLTRLLVKTHRGQVDSDGEQITRPQERDGPSSPVTVAEAGVNGGRENEAAVSCSSRVTGRRKQSVSEILNPGPDLLYDCLPLTAFSAALRRMILCRGIEWTARKTLVKQSQLAPEGLKLEFLRDLWGIWTSSVTQFQDVSRRPSPLPDTISSPLRSPPLLCSIFDSPRFHVSSHKPPLTGPSLVLVINSFSYPSLDHSSEASRSKPHVSSSGLGDVSVTGG